MIALSQSLAPPSRANCVEGACTVDQCSLELGSQPARESRGSSSRLRKDPSRSLLRRADQAYFLPQWAKASGAKPAYEPSSNVPRRERPRSESRVRARRLRERTRQRSMSARARSLSEDGQGETLKANAVDVQHTRYPAFRTAFSTRQRIRCVASMVDCRGRVAEASPKTTERSLDVRIRRNG